MVLDEIAKYIQDQGHGTIGTDLFKGELPDTSDSCVGLIEDIGLAPEFVHGTVGIAYERPAITVLCRPGQQDYKSARTKAQNIWTALANIKNQTLTATESNAFYLRGMPVDTPHDMGVDERNRDIIGFTVQFVKGLSV